MLYSKSISGLTSVSIESRKEKLIIAGGRDGKISSVNYNTRKIESNFIAHRKKILALKCVKNNSLTISGSSDKTIGLWNRCEKTRLWRLKTYLHHHSAPVNDIDIHPLNEYFVSCSDDATWSFSSLEKEVILQKVC